MTVAILKNDREGDVLGFMIGFCSDGNLGEVGFAGDPQFNQVTFPQTEAGAGAPCTKFQPMVAWVQETARPWIVGWPFQGPSLLTNAGFSPP